MVFQFCQKTLNELKLLFFNPKSAIQNPKSCLNGVFVQALIRYFVELTKILRINNDLGLHARSAARIVKLVEQHNAELFLRKGDREVDGSSILAILTLACPKGTDIQIRTVGEDSEPLMARLSDLFTQKFDESYDESSRQADE